MDGTVPYANSLPYPKSRDAIASKKKTQGSRLDYTYLHMVNFTLQISNMKELI